MPIYYLAAKNYSGAIGLKFEFRFKLSLV